MTLIHRPASYIERLDLSQLFPTTHGRASVPASLSPLEVELGAGDGSFLIAWAKTNPEHNFIAIERLLGRIRKIERKATRAGLQNVRLIRIEASYFLEYLLPPHSVTALHVYFPDPWPKRKHRKHRLINETFAANCARALAPGGAIYLRTDDPDYFAQMQSVFHRFTPIPTPLRLAAITTDFERGFHTRSIITRSTAYALP